MILIYLIMHLNVKLNIRLIKSTINFRYLDPLQFSY